MLQQYFKVAVSVEGPFKTFSANPVLDLMVHNGEQHQRFVTRVFGPARSFSCLGEYSYVSFSSAFGKEFLVLFVMNTPDERAAAARAWKVLLVLIGPCQRFIFAATDVATEEAPRPAAAAR